MIPITICLVFTFVSAAIIFKYIQTKNNKFLKSNQKSIENDGEIKKWRSSGKIVTRLSWVKMALWFITFGGQRPTNLFMYFASLNKMVEIKLRGSKFLIINDFKTSKEALKNFLISGRPKLAILDFYSQGVPGIAMNEGKEGQEHRKFCQTHLKAFGVGTKATESFIQNEVDKLCENWSSKEGTKFSPNNDFYIPVINSLWLILSGEKASAENSKWIFRYYRDLLSLCTPFNVMVSAMNASLGTILRLHNYVPLFGSFKNFSESTLNLRSYFQNMIDEKKNHGPSEYSTDLVDAYLNQISIQGENGATFSSKVNEKQLLTVLFDIIFAGGDTTGSTLSWVMLHLVRNPQIQDKIWEEIDSVVGRDRNPCLDDRPKCPYTEACIHEILRFTPAAPLGLPHATLDETIIESHRVEKGTVVLINIYGMHHDPSIWGDPQNFRPERFLSKDGKSFVRNEAMCIFSSGPRKCIGDQVARDTLFLFTSTICKRFLLKPDPLLGGFPPLRESNGTAQFPQKFYMIAEDRFKNKQ